MVICESHRTPTGKVALIISANSKEISHPTPTRLTRVRKFQIDWASPKDRDYRRFLCVFLHAVIMQRLGNAPDETSGWHRNTIVWVKIASAVYPPRTGQHNG